MSKLMNASPSWSSCLNVECASILFRNYSLNLTNKSYQAADIFDVHDEKLFSAMCLHHLLPSECDTGHDLRHRGQPYQLVCYNYSASA